MIGYLVYGVLAEEIVRDISHRLDGYCSDIPYFGGDYAIDRR